MTGMSLSDHHLVSENVPNLMALKHQDSVEDLIQRIRSTVLLRPIMDPNAWELPMLVEKDIVEVQ